MFSDIMYIIMLKEDFKMNKSAIKLAFKDTVPVMTGYIFLGFGFGILMYQNGYNFLWSTATSLLVYAGSMQYVGVGLLTSCAGILTTALTTLLVNARHLFYGISMVESYKGTGKKKPYLIFSLTDETFSLVSKCDIPDNVNRHKYYLSVSVFDQFYWVFGTFLGGIAGTVLPINLDGIEFVLTALFVTIFVEQWLCNKNHLPAIIGVVATTISLLIFSKDVFLIPAMVAITGVLSMMSKVRKEPKND